MEQNDPIRLYFDAKFDDLKNQIAGIALTQKRIEDRLDDVEHRVNLLEVKSARKDERDLVHKTIMGMIISALSGVLGFFGGMFSHHH